MRYTVDVLGESIQVDVRDGAAGLEVSVGGEPHVRATLIPAPAPLHTLRVGDQSLSVIVAETPHQAATFDVTLEGKRPVQVAAVDALTHATASARGAVAGGGGPRVQRSAMPGVVVELRVEAGQPVSKGQVLLILEAMKMQNEICAQGDAVVKQVHVAAGEAVAAGAKLIEFGA